MKLERLRIIGRCWDPSKSAYFKNAHELGGLGRFLLPWAILSHFRTHWSLHHRTGARPTEGNRRAKPEEKTKQIRQVKYIIITLGGRSTTTQKLWLRLLPSGLARRYQGNSSLWNQREVKHEKHSSRRHGGAKPYRFVGQLPQFCEYHWVCVGSRATEGATQPLRNIWSAYHSREAELYKWWKIQRVCLIQLSKNILQVRGCVCWSVNFVERWTPTVWTKSENAKKLEQVQTCSN